MTQELEDAIKKKIGYTEEPVPKCRNCQRVYSRGDGMPNGSAIYRCSIASLVIDIPVNPDARCERFKRRQPCDSK